MANYSLRQIAEILKLEICNRNPAIIQSQDQTTVSQAFVGDLLSEVMAKAPYLGIIITIQSHLNIIAVAYHVEAKAVIITGGKTPEAKAITAADENNIVVYTTEETSFDIVGRLFSLGFTSRRD